jgi:hypothetical protein
MQLCQSQALHQQLQQQIEQEYLNNYLVEGDCTAVYVTFH